MSIEDEELEYFKKHDPEYYNDFIALDRDENGAIYKNHKFLDFMKKHLHICFIGE